MTQPDDTQWRAGRAGGIAAALRYPHLMTTTQAPPTGHGGDYRIGWRIGFATIRNQVARGADAVLADIHADMGAGTVPRDVGSFSGLHDHVDANCYLIDRLPGEGGADGDDDHLALANLVSDEVDRRLAAEALKLGTGQRCGDSGGGDCGRLVRFNGGSAAGGHWVHLDDGSHQCAPCQFCRPQAAPPQDPKGARP